ncbi:GNAT family N-acetyltransferase [Sodalis sp. RH24]|uniref:bifunctional helix-turn-helix transcriptional regulator/GNAT family N-acetyltransferase n=1 Tax=unclassified Sodalis (in: enterobacteria) TaxID=2636512 RepID=UPI0039B3CE17
MTEDDLPLVDGIRAASRQMVRKLGFMQSTLAATDYPPSAVHAMVEIGARGDMTAAQLTELLGLEKSSVSRMVRKLINAGEVKETASAVDGRVKLLALTAAGQRTRAVIEAFARQQVRAALERMQQAERQAVARGLALYAQALTSHGQAPAQIAAPVRIDTGYQPAVIGRIVQMHAHFYSRHTGFGQFFEAKVASGLAEFTARLAHPDNQLWTAVDSGRIVGSVAIDGEDLPGRQAHLRWFIVEEGLHGAGIGRRLLQEALAFCDRRAFTATQLWTFSGLDAARRLYESQGFVLAEASPGRQWGREVMEQRFVRPCHAD